MKEDWYAGIREDFGRNAGSKTCGVCYSFMKDKLLEMKADYYIEDLIEILDIVQAV